MQSIVSNPLLDQIRVRENLLPYLQHTGWKRIESDNPRWIVFNGHEDVAGDPIELVFPIEASAEEDARYAAKAITALSVLDDKPIDMLIRSVVNYDRDQFYLRNIESSDGRIPLSLATRQIDNLQIMIAASAIMEKSKVPLPYSYNLQRGRKLQPNLALHTQPRVVFALSFKRLDWMILSNLNSKAYLSTQIQRCLKRRHSKGVWLKELQED